MCEDNTILKLAFMTQGTERDWIHLAQDGDTQNI
jgi:hypothetical protein